MLTLLYFVLIHFVHKRMLSVRSWCTLCCLCYTLVRSLDLIHFLCPFQIKSSVEKLAGRCRRKLIDLHVVTAILSQAVPSQSLYLLFWCDILEEEKSTHCDTVVLMDCHMWYLVVKFSINGPAQRLASYQTEFENVCISPTLHNWPGIGVCHFNVVALTIVYYP